MKKTLKMNMRNALECVFQKRKLHMEDIVEMMKASRELYDLERVVLVTNWEYKYQLNQIVSCERRGTNLEMGDGVELTEAQYDALAFAFSESPVRTNIPETGYEYHGSVLHGGIVQNGGYYGHVAFCSAQVEHVWTEEERDALSDLSYLLLIFFGLNNLNDSLQRYDREKLKFQNDAISSGFFLNLQTGKCHAVKLASFLQDKVHEWEDYQNLLRDYVDSYVDPFYGRQIAARFDAEALKRQLSLQSPTVMMDYPRAVHDKVSWFRCVAELAACDENGVPTKAYFYFKNVTNTVHAAGVSEINEHIYAVISSLDLETEQYAVYVDNLDAAVKDKVFLSYGGYRDLIRKMAEIAIDRSYTEQFEHIFSIQNLREHFERSSEILSYEFPYCVNLTTYWVKLEAVRTQHYAKNRKKIVLYFSDITEQKKRDLELQAVSRTLEKEHERVLEAELQVMVDPLTGAYNRAGFERAVRQYREEAVPLGFVLIDVDNFKAINDTYGHEFGDEVLVAIAHRLQTAFRNEDKVFRMGGDEFALLLYGCGADAWNSLQMKFSNIHHFLKKTVQRDIAVTLSAGFSQSDEGYRDDLMQLADEALYHTKSAERAGLTQISREHEILHTWHDAENAEGQTAMPKAALHGTWRIEYSKDADRKPRFFLDENAHILLGISNALTPEECFSYWLNRVVERHRELYDETLEKLLTTGQAECTYHWVHPTRGEIALRAGAKCRDNGSSKELFGYMQETQESSVVLSYDDAQFLMQALNKIYFCTYYFDLRTRSFYIVKGHEDDPNVKERHENVDQTFRNFVERFVHPDFREQVAAFSDLNTLSDRLRNKTHIDCDYRSMTGLGWCRTRIMPVKWDADGNLTHAVSMSASVDDTKRAELEKEKAVRDAMELQLHVSEVIAKTSVAQTCIIDRCTGETKIWLGAIFADQNITCSFDAMKEWGRQHVYEKDAIYFEEHFDLPHILEQVDRDGELELSYRHIAKDNRLATVIHHFGALPSDPKKLLLVIEDVSDLVPKGIEWMHQFDILEEVNESIAIFDYDTYDIIYMNKIARELIGMDMPTLRTKKCYELFGDTGAPCSFCDHVILNNGKNGFMCREVKGTGRTFLLHGAAMEINGKRYRVEQAVPASDVDSSIDYLQNLLTTEQKLMTCVQNLIRISDADQALAYLLDRIVAYYDCNRACLSKLTGEHRGTIITERCRAGMKRKFRDGEVLTLADFMQWEKVYSPINLRKVFCEGDESADQRWMREEKIDNLMILSFEYGSGQYGYISIDGVRQHKDDSNWIGTLAFFVANEMQKKEQLQ